ncbi:tetratricopeptide repeat protein [Aeromicrobium duanguangcaii]|uniref:Tetratricopeptide repeat protein n=1 Tax=Aeromicrobium duanguangcaii TaxID=2968086 RepID=A0ABY5KC78_9ACTN|nr:tetratricopeptide repeat protein [Aeromicrobium duanguangcaii]MCD9154962.1 tetratricopeptide repeat protein [Aeromicrobium duanguangcaii]UUI67633.1 tetratricopeptide repeat protein [Aeromicrobium duanguangcaii]
MSFSQPGAFDLSSLAKPRPAAGGATPAPAGAVYVIDVNEADFQQVVESSMQHLVVLSVWSPRAPQSVEFNEVLAAATSPYGGALQLAKVDADANPGIAQALQVQTVPFVVGLVQGRPVPLFQGTVDASEVKRFFDELVRLAQENGLTGRAQPSGGAPAAEPEEPEDDPRFAAADEAYGRGDFDAAIAEYEALLAQTPGDAEVVERLAATKLYARIAGADLQAARQAAADAPDDVDAQLLVADLDVTGGHIEDAFLRLIDLVKRTSEDDRERVRQHLLDLFTVVGLTDPRVAQARRSLAAALF